MTGSTMAAGGTATMAPTGGVATTAATPVGTTIGMPSRARDSGRSAGSAGIGDEIGADAQPVTLPTTTLHQE